ncbi:hypothetical protein BCON_0344g00040 [Botryotinia convoluta]|uniref:Uncharacterized protein n=1 Tax=Botryotinia convoluta TaxID=54673 RepID=A0A4Z1HFM3_9HELO|nr:hypothetical protein BCON_0344g00040 [Botryotinia convoluta]
MPARLAFKRMITFAGFVATSAATGTLGCYSANRAYDYMRPTSARPRSIYPIEAVESTAFVMFYRYFKPSWQVMCAVSVYDACNSFCRAICINIFNDCQRGWDKIKLEDEAASNLETREKKSLDNEDSFVEDTTS